MGRPTWLHSHALDLDKGVFTWKLEGHRGIAETLRRGKQQPQGRSLSVGAFHVRFYMNRAGKNLPLQRRRTLEQARDELRKQVGKEK